MGSIVIWGMEAGVLRYVSNLPYGIYTRCGAFPGYPYPPVAAAMHKAFAAANGSADRLCGWGQWKE